MSKLHPTAIIHPSAELAEDVCVGPYAIIEAGVVIGAGGNVAAHAQLLARTVLGDACVIGHGAIIGGDPQSLAFDVRLPSNVVLGKRNVVREHVTIHRSMYEEKSTMIGDDNFFMAASHVGHDGQMGNRNVIANNVLFAGHVEVGNHCFFGGASVFHQFIRVGDYAMIQGKSGFSMDVPPFVIGTENNLVAGMNIVGMKRAGFTLAQRQELKRAFDLIYRSGRNLSQALAATQELTWTGPAAQFVAFIAGYGKKGIAPLRFRSRAAE
jgi:UDP-N-acetylglucosamine acyltransferase